MTKQEAAQKIWDWFSRPDAVLGYDIDNEKCVYRGGRDVNSNVRCGVGCLIPDELYTSLIENSTAEQITSYALAEAPDSHELTDEDEAKLDKLISFLNEIGGEFLNDVQTIHDDLFRHHDDDAPTPQAFLKQFKSYCDRHGIETH